MQAETPHWLNNAPKTITSLGTYKQTRIPISEELVLYGNGYNKKSTNFLGRSR
jgi:hypothetical protein